MMFPKTSSLLLVIFLSYLLKVLTHNSFQLAMFSFYQLPSDAEFWSVFVEVGFSCKFELLVKRPVSSGNPPSSHLCVVVLLLSQALSGSLVQNQILIRRFRCLPSCWKAEAALLAGRAADSLCCFLLVHIRDCITLGSAHQCLLWFFSQVH